MTGGVSSKDYYNLLQYLDKTNYQKTPILGVPEPAINGISASDATVLSKAITAGTLTVNPDDETDIKTLLGYIANTTDSTTSNFNDLNVNNVVSSCDSNTTVITWSDIQAYISSGQKDQTYISDADIQAVHSNDFLADYTSTCPNIFASQTTFTQSQIDSTAKSLDNNTNANSAEKALFDALKTPGSLSTAYTSLNSTASSGLSSAIKAINNNPFDTSANTDANSAISALSSASGSFTDAKAKSAITDAETSIGNAQTSETNMSSINTDISTMQSNITGNLDSSVSVSAFNTVLAGSTSKTPDTDAKNSAKFYSDLASYQSGKGSITVDDLTADFKNINNNDFNYGDPSTSGTLDGDWNNFLADYKNGNDTTSDIKGLVTDATLDTQFTSAVALNSADSSLKSLATDSSSQFSTDLANVNSDLTAAKNALSAIGDTTDSADCATDLKASTSITENYGMAQSTLNTDLSTVSSSMHSTLFNSAAGGASTITEADLINALSSKSITGSDKTALQYITNLENDYVGNLLSSNSNKLTLDTITHALSDPLCTGNAARFLNELANTPDLFNYLATPGAHPGDSAYITKVNLDNFSLNGKDTEIASKALLANTGGYDLNPQRIIQVVNTLLGNTSTTTINNPVSIAEIQSALTASLLPKNEGNSKTSFEPQEYSFLQKIVSGGNSVLSYLQSIGYSGSNISNSELESLDIDETGSIDQFDAAYFFNNVSNYTISQRLQERQLLENMGIIPTASDLALAGDDPSACQGINTSTDGEEATASDG